MKRKLTTIFYADAVGFSHQMETDEAATLERLRRARSLMRECFERHDGREVNTWGDAVIAEFASVVEAVRCAVSVQEAMEGGEHEPRLRFRIGVNLGDVMIDGDNLYGDGVNVAERLQSLAEPGGVMVSGAVRDLTWKQLAVGFDYAGEQPVKSLEEPVACWRTRMGENRPPEPEPEEDAPPPEAAGPVERWVGWFRSQPRAVRRAAGMIVFFFTINVVFGGLSTPWFIFPSIPFALLILRKGEGRLPLRRRRLP